MSDQVAQADWLTLLKKKFEGYFTDPNDPIIYKWLTSAQRGIELKGRQHVEAVQRCFGGSLEGIRVLDAGCGSGDLSFAFGEAGATVVGVDIDPDFIQICEMHQSELKQPNTRFVLSDLSEGLIAINEDPFDIIISVDVIEHVKAPGPYLNHLNGMLKPNGHLYLLTGNKFALSNICRDPHYKLAGVVLMPKRLAHWYVCKLRQKVKHFDVEKMFSVNGLGKLVQQHGFSIVSISQFHAQDALERRPGIMSLLKPLRLEVAWRFVYEQFWAHTIRFWAENKSE